MGNYMVRNSLGYRSWTAALLAVILLYLLTGGATVSAQEGATVFIQPDTQVISVNGETEIEVRVADVSNLYGVEFHLSFDAGMIEVIDADPGTDGIQINPGDFLVPGVSANVTSLNQVDNVQGVIDFAITLVAGDAPVSGSGVLATIGLRCLSQGTAEIVFENPVDGQAPVKLADGDGKPITVTWAGGSLDSTVKAGDANGDSTVNIFDMTKVARIILELDDPTPGADANQDGSINIFDMTKIARIILELD
jgi:hypothetical protein